MITARILAGALFASSLAIASSALPGCGNADPNNRDFGAPPDATLFNPNPGGNDPYGGYGDKKPEQPFVCPDVLKRCTHTITYPYANQTTVELRGDFGGPETWVTGKPMAKKGDVWSVDITIPYDKPIQFKFVVDGQWVTDPAQPTVPDGNNTNNTFAGKKCEPALCEEDGPLPAGVFDWRDSVIYFVFVDRFLNGDPNNDCTVANVSGGAGSIANYQGGDWKGVTQKINEGYFTDLGVNTLWITVPFDNTDVAGRGQGGDSHMYSGFHGYWPKVDSDNPSTIATESCFGSLAELKTLVSSAHAKGLKVLIDYAMVHVHSSSKVFADHPDWFWSLQFNNGTCVCDDSGVCPWNTQGHRCWFTDYLPHWDYTKQAARDFSVANAVEWIKQTQDASGNGVDGFRADAIKHVDMQWLTDLRKKITTDIVAKQTPQQRFYMVGETYDFGNRDLLKTYVDPATKLDGQFDFPLRGHVVDALVMRKESMTDLASFMNSNDYFYGSQAVMSTFIGNHDLPRIIHLAQNQPLWDAQYRDGKDRAWQNQPVAVDELAAFERVANGFALLYTNRGAPLVYYGDEIGMPGGGDPDNRRFMQWSGLSANQTWLRDRLKKLGDIRSKHAALRRGIRTTLEVNADLWAYSRITTGDEVYVVMNRSDQDKSSAALPAVPMTDLVTGEDVTGPTVSVAKRQTRILVKK